MKTPLLLAVLLSLTAFTSATILLQDNFDAPVINQSLWFNDSDANEIFDTSQGYLNETSKDAADVLSGICNLNPFNSGNATVTITMMLNRLDAPPSNSLTVRWFRNTSLVYTGGQAELSGTGYMLYHLGANDVEGTPYVYDNGVFTS